MSVFTRSPHSTVLTDENGYKLDATTPLPVDPAESGAVNYATSQVSVLSSATQLVTANATRRAVLVTNNDTATAIFVGGAAVTTGNGHKLVAGASLTLPVIGAVYAISATGTVVASVTEVYD